MKMTEKERQARMKELQELMKPIADKLNELNAQRNLSFVGKAQYVSPKEFSKLTAKWRKLEKEYRELYFMNDPAYVKKS